MAPSYHSFRGKQGSPFAGEFELVGPLLRPLPHPGMVPGFRCAMSAAARATCIACWDFGNFLPILVKGQERGALGMTCRRMGWAACGILMIAASAAGQGQDLHSLSRMTLEELMRIEVVVASHSGERRMGQCTRPGRKSADSEAHFSFAAPANSTDPAHAPARPKLMPIAVRTTTVAISDRRLSQILRIINFKKEAED